MALVNRDGVRVYYEAHGTGPAVLLTHGYTSTGEAWRGQVEALSAAHTLVTWDMRGHGRSDYPDDEAAYSEAATVADMAAILDAVGAERAVVGGLSLGGYMSLAFWRAYPQRVAALIVADAGPGYRDEAGRARWNADALHRAERFEREGLAALGGGADSARTWKRHRSAQGLARAARGMLVWRDAAVIDALPRIDAPTLIVVGERDASFLSAADYMAAKVPGARKAVIAGAGHVSNIDRPAAFNRAVTEFLAGLSLGEARGNTRLATGEG